MEICDERLWFLHDPRWIVSHSGRAKIAAIQETKTTLPFELGTVPRIVLRLGMTSPRAMPDAT
jgi:hypothetical protein